jgi:hypothetical protein
LSRVKNVNNVLGLQVAAVVKDLKIDTTWIRRKVAGPSRAINNVEANRFAENDPDHREVIGGDRPIVLRLRVGCETDADHDNQPDHGRS